jgi:hypothetical protein
MRDVSGLLREGLIELKVDGRTVSASARMVA